MSKKINYSRGTHFAVPLRDVGFARGVVARMDGKGGVFGYFFGPRLSSAEEAKSTAAMAPDAAILLRDVGDLGLVDGKWPIFGQLPDFTPDAWPMPPRIRVDEVSGKAWLSYYDEDTFECLRDIPVDAALASEYPEDGTSGYGALEIRLTKLLRKAD